jgi:hypothetical protein
MPAMGDPLLEVLRAAERASMALMPDDPWQTAMETIADALAADLIEHDLEEVS